MLKFCVIFSYCLYHVHGFIEIISTFTPQIDNLCFLFLFWWVWLYLYQFHWSFQKPVFGYFFFFFSIYCPLSVLFISSFLFFHLLLLLSLFYFDYFGVICFFFLLSQGGTSDIELRTFLPVLTQHLHIDTKSFADNMRRYSWKTRIIIDFIVNTPIQIPKLKLNHQIVVSWFLALWRQVFVSSDSL